MARSFDRRPAAHQSIAARRKQPTHHPVLEKHGKTGRIINKVTYGGTISPSNGRNIPRTRKPDFTAQNHRHRTYGDNTGTPLSPATSQLGAIAHTEAHGDTQARRPPQQATITTNHVRRHASIPTQPTHDRCVDGIWDNRRWYFAYGHGPKTLGFDEFAADLRFVRNQSRRQRATARRTSAIFRRPTYAKRWNSNVS